MDNALTGWAAVAVIFGIFALFALYALLERRAMRRSLRMIQTQGGMRIYVWTSLFGFDHSSRTHPLLRTGSRHDSTPVADSGSFDGGGGCD